MRVTYDRLVDAAYIYFAQEIGDGEVKHTYACDVAKVHGQINLDFDDKGVILGVEVLDASKRLPEAVLKQAELI